MDEYTEYPSSYQTVAQRLLADVRGIVIADDVYVYLAASDAALAHGREAILSC